MSRPITLPPDDPEIHAALAAIPAETREAAAALVSRAFHEEPILSSTPAMVRSAWLVAVGEAKRVTQSDHPEATVGSLLEPLPLVPNVAVPDFPTELLPTWLRDMADGMAEEHQTAKAAPALLCVTTVGAAIMGKVEVHVRHTWYVPANLYSMTVADSSDLKSPAFVLATAPVDAWERDTAAAMRESVVKAESAKAMLEIERQELEKKFRKLEDESERRDKGKEIANLALKIDAAERALPRPPRLIASDVTEERIGTLLQKHDRRLGIFSDEGGPIRNLKGRYKDVAVFEALKHGYNAGTVRVDRQGREGVNVPKATLSIGLMVQPSVLEEFRSTPEFRGEGLVARFVYAWPQSRVGVRDVHSEGVAQTVVDEYGRNIRHLLDLPFGSDSNGAVAAHVMQLEPEALALLEGFMEDIEPRLGPSGDLHHVRDWAGKLRGTVVRFAVILTIAERVGQNEPWREPIPASSMEGALKIVRDFVIPHGLKALSVMGANPEVNMAQGILAAIQRHGWTEEFTRRDVFNQVRSRATKVEDLNAALDLLVELGWLVNLGTKKTGGRPGGPFYVAHPKVLTGEWAS